MLKDSFFARHKILATLGILAAVAVVFFLSLRRGPYHDYTLDLMIPDLATAEKPGQLQAGVAIRDITPDMNTYDTWEDSNGNGKWDKEDKIIKRAASRGFQPAWIAGFQIWRPALSVHNPQWVRALALRNNGVTVVMVTIDSVGIYHNDYITIRKMIHPAVKVDHVLFSATHSHSLIDTMKLWSGRIPVLGYDERYMTMLQQKAKEAIEEAVFNLQPADMYYTTVEVPEEGFVHDSRKPWIIHPEMGVWRLLRAHTDQTIATLVNWGNHPEVMDGDNHHISSDFPHWLRLGMEKGVPPPNGMEGFGGVCLYFQGMLGGLMNPLRISVPHRDSSQLFEERTFEKTEHLGYNVALLAGQALRGADVWKNESPYLSIAARTIKARMTGLFKYGIMLGLIHQGYYWGGYAKTEVNVLRIGDVMALTVPGELYPEIVVGGIEAKPGRDFDIPPVEVPPLMREMKVSARQALVFGLANDEIGYIIPKTQWDVEAPYIYNDRAQYGEQNSGGPDVAAAVHGAALALIHQMNATYDRFPARRGGQNEVGDPVTATNDPTGAFTS